MFLISTVGRLFTKIDIFVMNDYSLQLVGGSTVIVNPDPAEPRNIWETPTNLMYIARKYPDALAYLLLTICMSITQSSSILKTLTRPSF